MQGYLDVSNFNPSQLGGQFAQAFAVWISGLQATMADGFTLFSRWVLPVLAIAILLRCFLPLLGGRKNAEPWGYLVMPNSGRLPLMHWENSIGRSRLSDIVIDLPFVSRSHAVLARHEDSWTVTDLGSKGGVEVNGKKVDGSETVQEGDAVSLAGVELTLVTSAPGDAPAAVKPPRRLHAGLTLALILLFQLIGGIQLCFAEGKNFTMEMPAVFLIFMLWESFHYLLAALRRKYFEFELLAYFLCGIGLFVTASASPGALFKQLAAIIVGVLLFFCLNLLMQNLDRAQKLRLVFLGAAVLLLVLNLAVGEIRHGAKNWIDLGFITFQPMEFVKIAFVLAGTATLDRLLTTRNLTSFLIFSGACVGTLAITKDFGTALVFFCAFLIIAFMRSGDIRTIALISVGAVLAAFAVVSFLPYVASRFQAWGHVWQYANTSGYQQTRTMVALASGGLLGVGGGHGYLVRVAAADTDLVFGVIGEEWGLILALAAVAVIVFFACFAVFSSGRCRSSFYAIAACGAAAILLMQTALNVFGSVDILPLTGVTMPFVSNGGSSMITCWCLLAFIKSADSRAVVPKYAGAGKGRSR